MTVVLGVDPGSRKTGYGVIQLLGNKLSYVASGVIRLDETQLLPQRLHVIFTQLSEIIARYRPDECAVEQVFMAKSAGSALKLGQARGAAVVAATCAGIEVFEYEARKVKQSVVGTGAAEKKQVQHMVKNLLNLASSPQEDAADALAVAMCHCHSRQHLIRSAGARQFRRGRLV